MDAASPAQADSSPSIESETVHSIAAGLSEMAEAVRTADAASAAASVQAAGESLAIPANQSFAGQAGEPEPPMSSAVARPTGGLFEDIAAPDAEREQFGMDAASPPRTDSLPSIDGEMVNSIAAGFGEMAEAVRTADVASAGPWAQAIAENRAIPAGESFIGQTGELEPPRSSKRRDADGRHFRVSGRARRPGRAVPHSGRISNDAELQR